MLFKNIISTLIMIRRSRKRETSQEIQVLLALLIKDVAAASMGKNHVGTLVGIHQVPRGVPKDRLVDSGPGPARAVAHARLRFQRVAPAAE